MSLLAKLRVRLEFLPVDSSVWADVLEVPCLMSEVRGCPESGGL